MGDQIRISDTGELETVSGSLAVPAPKAAPGAPEPLFSTEPFEQIPGQLAISAETP